MEDLQGEGQGQMMTSWLFDLMRNSKLHAKENRITPSVTPDEHSQLVCKSCHTFVAAG